MSRIHVGVVVVSLLMLASAYGVPQVATMRGVTEIAEQAAPPSMSKVDNSDRRRSRAYPMQPPIIPHHIDGYQVDLQVNKCMSCHARSRTGLSQAPMVSVTHYMDRDGNFLANVSPRRYFCSQCHVSQDLIEPPVANDFLDIDQVVSQSKSQ